MMRSLRNRLILSHVLPLVILIPLVGVAMVYLLETRVLLPSIYDNLVADATLMAEVTSSIPEIWVDPTLAQLFVQGADPYLGARITLLGIDGHILGSSDSSNAHLIGQKIELPNLSGTHRGDFIELREGPLAEVFTPVFAANGAWMGVIRLTTPVLTVSQQIYQLRYLLGGVVLLGLLAGIGLGSYLAISINRPVQRVTQAIRALEQGDFQSGLSEEGPEEVRTLAVAVNALVDRLRTLEEHRKQLLANLVHELGRPLGALNSATQALIKGADQDPELAADLILGIQGEINRMRRLLNDLAGLYGQVLGALELERQPIEISDWLHTVLFSWQVAAQEKGLAWTEEISEGLPVLNLDPDRLAQAVGNLCSNAIKFTPQGGQVTVSAGLGADRLWIRVRDSGPGIPPENRDLIFQPFFRGSHARIIQGMGLGLTIANEIATAHGGQITVDPVPGQGSQFTLWLPFQN
jgi:two-component system sensor histidine kinase BaeS